MNFDRWQKRAELAGALARKDSRDSSSDQQLAVFRGELYKLVQFDLTDCLLICEKSIDFLLFALYKICVRVMRACRLVGLQRILDERLFK